MGKGSGKGTSEGSSAGPSKGQARPTKRGNTSNSGRSKSAAARLAQLDREIAEILKEDEALRREAEAAGRNMPWWLQSRVPATLFLIALFVDALVYFLGHSYRSSLLIIAYIGTPLVLWLMYATGKQPSWQRWAQHSALERLAPLYRERDQLLDKAAGYDYDDSEPFADHPEIAEGEGKDGGK